MNLNGMLSSRIVAPRESFGKYYSDLLEQTPGWVPLLKHRPSARLIETVTAERGAAGAVLIEFAPDDVDEVMQDETVVYVPAQPFSRVVAIHLRDKRQLGEHRARAYTNIHPHEELLRVSPDLFTGVSPLELPFLPPATKHAVSWRRLDRIRGAMNAALASIRNKDQLLIVARFFGATYSPIESFLPKWVVFTGIDDHDHSVPRDTADSPSADHAVFCAAYDVLGDQDATEAWSPNAVLDAVTSNVQRSGLDEQASAQIARNLRRVRAIVNAEADFEPFRPTRHALVSAQALLLVLLRPDLQQLLAWPAVETAADNLTMTTAAVLAGRLRGLARETTELRTVAFDDITAEWAIQVAEGRPGPIGNVEVALANSVATLTINGVVLASSSNAPPK